MGKYNISTKRFEELLGITFTGEDFAELESFRSNSDYIRGDEWFCSERQFVVTCGSIEAECRLIDVLSKYSSHSYYIPYILTHTEKGFSTRSFGYGRS